MEAVPAPKVPMLKYILVHSPYPNPIFSLGPYSTTLLGPIPIKVGPGPHPFKVGTVFYLHHWQWSINNLTKYAQMGVSPLLSGNSVLNCPGLHFEYSFQPHNDNYLPNDAGNLKRKSENVKSTTIATF